MKNFISMENFRSMKIWLCWRSENKGNRKTKVPYGADGKPIGTDSKYENRWTDYSAALEAMTKYGFDGVGHIIPLGFGGIDEDDREDSDALTEEISRQFPTYVERSPSKRGRHRLFKCDISKIPQSNGKLDNRYYSKNPHNKLEIYIGGLTNRFFTFTGDIINDMPIADCTDAVI
jgi:primase-polymerase (primpol)-like protein